MPLDKRAYHKQAEKNKGTRQGKSMMVEILLLVVIGAIVLFVVFRHSSGTGETKKPSFDLFPKLSGETTQETTELKDLLNKQLSVNGTDYQIVNNNCPRFPSGDKRAKSFQTYAPLDSQGRCGVAYACIGKGLMPTEPRGQIGMIKPTGWHTIRYDDLIPDGKYLYNRCHLIGYQLTGQNANERNLITGTRYLNVELMEPLENEVASYIRRTGNHVLYRVTPDFRRNEQVARGVLMEAESVEDHGRGVRFSIYCPNIQPGISIDYRTGDSVRDRQPAVTTRRYKAA